MAVTLGGYLALWLPLDSLRYHFIKPLTAHGPFGSVPSVPVNAYVLGNSYATASGRPVDFSVLASACHTTHGGETGVPLSCLAAKGFQFSTTYQPDSRFWQIQGIETGIFVAAAVVLLGIAAWWAARRVN
jgi:hypothetical protein